MTVTIINKTDTEIKLKISKESHTMLNLLKTHLLNNKNVEIASYDIKHPTFSDPILFVRTKGQDPVEAIKIAAAEIIELCEEFKKTFSEKIKG